MITLRQPQDYSEMLLGNLGDKCDAVEVEMLVDILEVHSSARIEWRELQYLPDSHRPSMIDHEKKATKLELSRYLLRYITCDKFVNERGDIELTARINMPVLQDEYLQNKLYLLKSLISTPWYRKVYWFFVDSIRYDEYLRALRYRTGGRHG